MPVGVGGKRQGVRVVFEEPIERMPVQGLGAWTEFKATLQGDVEEQHDQLIRGAQREILSDERELAFAEASLVSPGVLGIFGVGAQPFDIV